MEGCNPRHTWKGLKGALPPRGEAGGISARRTGCLTPDMEGCNPRHTWKGLKGALALAVPTPPVNLADAQMAVPAPPANLAGAQLVLDCGGSGGSTNRGPGGGPPPLSSQRKHQNHVFI